MRIHGLGGLGITDTDTLNPGTIITFTVHSAMCTGVSNQDVATALNNWLSQMMSIVSVANTWEGVLPTVLDKEVTATITNAVTAGDLRGQIMAALAADTQCNGLVLVNNVINIASGGTNPGLPDTPNPFGISPMTLALLGAVIGLVIVSRK